MTPDQIKRAYDLLELRDRVCNFNDELEADSDIRTIVRDEIAVLSLPEREMRAALNLLVTHIEAELFELGTEQFARVAERERERDDD